MAKDPETSKPVDKGKGKAAEKPAAENPEGKNEDKKEEKIGAAEELSEEDQQLKNDLDMLVERLTESQADLYEHALNEMKTSIRTSTSSMTAVPKPLKFLRPHYETLKVVYEDWPSGNNKDSLADVLSAIGMTFSDEDNQDTLKYRLLSPTTDIDSWGHEYVRLLALQIGEVFAKRITEEEPTNDLIDLALQLVPLFLKSNAEADAVDLLSELEIIDRLPEFLNADTYSRACLYLVSMVNLLTYPDNDLFLRTAYGIYIQYKQLTQAMTVAIRLNDVELITSTFAQTTDVALKKQLAFLVGRQRIVIEHFDDDEEINEEIAKCCHNTHLSKYFQYLGKELNLLEPKMPEDIYKTHLESSRVSNYTNTDSALHNLSAAFVNAFANAGFVNDKMMIGENIKEQWVWKTKADGMTSTVASIGSIMLWNNELGLDTIDKYLGVSESEICAGGMLGIGIMSSGVYQEDAAAIALLGDQERLQSKDLNVRTAAIMGLGLAHAGSNNETILDLLTPLINDASETMQISAMAALACGMTFIGSSHSEISSAIVSTLLDDDRMGQLTDKWTRFLALGLGLLFFGKQEEVDVILETLKAVDHPMAKPTRVLAQICAWAGTGAVLKIQELLHICTEHLAEKEDKKGDELLQSYAVLGIALIAMGEDVGQEMVLRHFGHLMHYGEANIRRTVPLAMGLISPSNPQMKVYDTLSRYSHDTDSDVANSAIFSMGLLGAGTNNARLAQLLRQLASFYYRDSDSLFMVRIAQGLVHMGKGTLTVNPFHTDRQILSHVAAASLLTCMVAMIDAKDFIFSKHHYLLYFLTSAIYPRMLVTLDENLEFINVNVRVGQAVDVVGQAGRPKTITGWQTQSTPVVLAYGERAELENKEYISLSSTLEGVVILRKVRPIPPPSLKPNW
ncbi:26S proteasome regulatory subunit rpn-1 [Ceratocystis lukuohia]|uniref:26S proteasome regulatory subunit RPN1 n=1 Tax=Ceratocystis lukuohia TaxID=2019550 RepID=A0ABR4MQ27_9PEZI